MKKKGIIFFLIWMVLLTACSMPFNQKMIYIENDIMSNEFNDTLCKSFSGDNDTVSFSLVSFENELAPIKMLAVQNLCGLHQLDIENYKESHNEYRYSIEKSIYEMKNCVLLDYLDSGSYEEDFFEAFYVSEIIGDEELKGQVCEKYIACKLEEKDFFSEQIYQYINSSYSNKEKILNINELKIKTQKVLDEQIKNDVLDTSIEGLADMAAALAFLLYEEDESQNDKIEILYQSYCSEINEWKMGFDIDISLEYYCRIISYMRQIGSFDIEEDFFYTQAEEGKEYFQSVVYDITSPRNYANYVIALCYRDEKISGEEYEALKQLLLRPSQPDFQRI